MSRDGKLHREYDVEIAYSSEVLRVRGEHRAPKRWRDGSKHRRGAGRGEPPFAAGAASLGTPSLQRSAKSSSLLLGRTSSGLRNRLTGAAGRGPRERMPLLLETSHESLADDDDDRDGDTGTDGGAGSMDGRHDSEGAVLHGSDDSSNEDDEDDRSTDSGDSDGQSLGTRSDDDDANHHRGGATTTATKRSLQAGSRDKSRLAVAFDFDYDDDDGGAAGDDGLDDIVRGTAGGSGSLASLSQSSSWALLSPANALHKLAEARKSAATSGGQATGLSRFTSLTALPRAPPRRLETNDSSDSDRADTGDWDHAGATEVADGYAGSPPIVAGGATRSGVLSAGPLASTVAAASAGAGARAGGRLVPARGVPLESNDASTTTAAARARGPAVSAAADGPVRTPQMRSAAAAAAAARRNADQWRQLTAVPGSRPPAARSDDGSVSTAARRASDASTAAAGAASGSHSSASGAFMRETQRAHALFNTTQGHMVGTAGGVSHTLAGSAAGGGLAGAFGDGSAARAAATARFGAPGAAGAATGGGEKVTQTQHTYALNKQEGRGLRGIRWVCRCGDAQWA